MCAIGIQENTSCYLIFNEAFLEANEKTLNLISATVKARTKKRFSLVIDENMINLMKTVGKKIPGASRGVDPSKGQVLFGVFLLPTNNVIEIYREPSGEERAILFNNIDVWLSFELSDLNS